MDDDKIDLRILYVHGLESGPIGYKSVLLRSRYKDVISVDMDMSVLNIRKKHSAVRNLLKIQILPLIAFMLLCTLLLYFLIFNRIAALKSNSWQITLSVIASLILYPIIVFAIPYFRNKMIGYALKRSFEQCCNVQTKVIKENNYKFDLVIGSSWGGAIACHLIKTNVWQGPTIVLCPAYKKVMDMIAYTQCKSRCLHNQDDHDTNSYAKFDSNNVNKRGGELGKSVGDYNYNSIMSNGKNSKINKWLIVHGKNDQTVPYQDSVLLQQLNPDKFELKLIENESHRMKTFAGSGQLFETIESYLQLAQ